MKDSSKKATYLLVLVCLIALVMSAPKTYDLWQSIGLYFWNWLVYGNAVGGMY